MDENHTRLIVRESFAKGAMPPAALFAMEMPDAVMELKALGTVRRGAEGAGASGGNCPWRSGSARKPSSSH